MEQIHSSEVDAYIASFPEETRAIMEQIREMVFRLVPEVTEKISYGMPGYFFNGPLVYFAGYKKHIGFYPTPEGIEAFLEEISKYKWAKGSVQFPLNQPMPYDLIEAIIIHRYQIALGA